MTQLTTSGFTKSTLAERIAERERARHEAIQERLAELLSTKDE